MTNTTGGNAPIPTHPSASHSPECTCPICAAAAGLDLTRDVPEDDERVTVETFAIVLSGQTGMYFATRRRWWTQDVAAEYGAGVAIAAVDETQVHDLIADNTNLDAAEIDLLRADLVDQPGTIQLVDPDGGRVGIPAVELAAIMVLAVPQAELVRTMTRMASQMVTGR